MIWKRKRLGLALGGGGARGIAHVGVLRVFEEESIPVDLIVGTSIGALVGAAYATGQNTLEMEERIEEFLKNNSNIVRLIDITGFIFNLMFSHIQIL